MLRRVSDPILRKFHHEVWTFNALFSSRTFGHLRFKPEVWEALQFFGPHNSLRIMIKHTIMIKQTYLPVYTLYILRYHSSTASCGSGARRLLPGKRGHQRLLHRLQPWRWWHRRMRRRWSMCRGKGAVCRKRWLWMTDITRIWPRHLGALMEM